MIDEEPDDGKGLSLLTTVVSAALAATFAIMLQQAESRKLKAVALQAWDECAAYMTAHQRREDNFLAVPVCAPTVKTDATGERFAVAFSDGLAVVDGNARRISPLEPVTTFRLVATAVRTDDYMRPEQWSPLPTRDQENGLFRDRLEGMRWAGMNFLGVRRFLNDAVTPSVWSGENFFRRIGGLLTVAGTADDTAQITSQRPLSAKAQAPSGLDP